MAATRVDDPSGLTMSVHSASGRRSRSGWPLRVASGCGAVAVVLVVGVAAVAARPDGPASPVLSAALGGAGALGALVVGLVVVSAVARVLPAMSLLVALMTFALQVTIAVAVLAAVSGDLATGSSVLSPSWLGLGMGATAAAWIVGQVVGTMTARVLVFDEPHRSAGDHPASGAADASEAARS